METKFYCVAAIVVAVLAPSALADCKTTKGAPNFNFQDLCGKVFSVAASSAIGDALSCIANWIECDKNNASLATMHTTLITEGEKPQKQTYTFVYLGNAIIARYYDEGDFWRTQVITSYAANGNNFKMGFIICRDDEAKPTRKAVVSNYKADFNDDVKILDDAAPDDSMTWLENTCNPNDYVDADESK